MGGPGEATSLMALVAPRLGQFRLHIDLHETTDSDESEFRPALAARDGKPFEPGLIPDGFYLVADAEDPQLEFQQAVIAAVAAVTHFAPADDSGQIIGCPVIAPGIITYPQREYGMCPAITGARYTTTTEVYPDSPRSTPQQCNDAQVAAVCTALDFVLAERRLGPYCRRMIEPHPSGGYILDELVVGMTAEKRVTVTEARVGQFAEASDDFNPVHMDEAFASRTAYRGRIAHGLLSASFGSAVVGTILPGAGAIYLGQTLNFHRPVRIGDVASARVTVAAIDEAAARVVLRCEVYVGRDLVMDGEATVRVPRRRRPPKAP